MSDTQYTQRCHIDIPISLDVLSEKPNEALNALGDAITKIITGVRESYPAAVFHRAAWTNILDFDENKDGNNGYFRLIFVK